jgi:hypothetical protein
MKCKECEEKLSICVINSDGDYSYCNNKECYRYRLLFYNPERK